jgi:hypothetical protein
MKNGLEKRNDDSMPGQEGAILFVVMLLIIMFTGLGLLAMRHTRQELRSTGAYFDNMQAASLAESALAMAATDIKLSSDFYRAAFSSADFAIIAADAGLDNDYEIPLNPEPGKREIGTHPVLFDTVLGGYCDDHTGTVSACVHQLSYPVSGSTDFDNMMGTWARTTIGQTPPKIGPCPPGYSCSDEQNYGWYIFTVDATSIYGQGGNGLSAPVPNANNYAQGRAQARGIMTVGPIGVFGQ